MSKVAIIALSIAFITLISFIGSLSFINHSQGKELAKLKAELANASTLLQAQNAQILQDKLELERYTKEAQKTKERIVTRYVNMSVKDGDCATQLNAIKKALETFYARDKKE